jgi:hypothetical protein
MLVLGTAITILVALARGARHFGWTWRRRTDHEIATDVHEFGGGVREGHGPLPLFWLLVALGMLFWSVGYIVYCGLHGV